MFNEKLLLQNPLLFIFMTIARHLTKRHVTLVLSILISTLTYGQNLAEIEPKVFDTVNYTKAEQVYWEKAMDLIQKN